MLIAIQNWIKGHKELCIMAVLGAAALIFMAFWAGSAGTIKKYKDFSTLEMEKRLDAEKVRDDLLRDKAALEEKISALEREFAQQTEDFDTMKKDLTQQRLVNKGMQEEMDKLIKARRELEEQLKQAVWQGKISSPAKTKK